MKKSPLHMLGIKHKSPLNDAYTNPPPTHVSNVATINNAVNQINAAIRAKGKCGKGMKWDATTEKCIKSTPKEDKEKVNTEEVNTEESQPKRKKYIGDNKIMDCHMNQGGKWIGGKCVIEEK